MTEVDLRPFARAALEVATAILDRYRTPFSKHQFTQPQLLAILCLMRYEDWTLRETEVRLREHGELRRVLRLRSVPDYTTVYRFLKRLEEKTINQALGEAARRLEQGVPGVGGAPAWPWMRQGWRQGRSARSSCGAGIIIRTSPCPGDTG